MVRVKPRPLRWGATLGGIFLGLGDVRFALPRLRYANGIHICQKEERAGREFREKSAQGVAVGGRVCRGWRAMWEPSVLGSFRCPVEVLA